MDWLSLHALAHRDVGSPSVAAAGEKPNWVLLALAVRPAARLVTASPRCAGNDTTCWNVGRFCQEMAGSVMPPKGDWTMLSAHHWSPAAHVLSPGYVVV